jgi:hypothetical protein
VGAAPNFNRAFDLARHPLFKWAAHDDLHASGFLGACVRALEQHPDAVLSYARAVEIDAEERELRPYGSSYAAACDPDVVTRFRMLIGDEHNCFPVFGVIRRDVLARTPRIGSFVGSDRALLVRLGLFGRFAEVSERLFLHREHPGRSTRAIPRHQRLAWFETRRSGEVAMPHWRLLSEYARAVAAAPLAARDRARCNLELARWLKRYRKRLVRDLRLRLARPEVGERAS